MQEIPVITGNEGLQRKNEGHLASGLMQAGKRCNAAAEGGAVSSTGSAGQSSFLPILSDHMATLTDEGPKIACVDTSGSESIADTDASNLQAQKISGKPRRGLKALPGDIGNRLDRQACAVDMASGSQEQASVEMTQDVQDRPVGDWTSDVFGATDMGGDADGAEEFVPAGQDMSAEVFLQQGLVNPYRSLFVEQAAKERQAPQIPKGGEGLVLSRIVSLVSQIRNGDIHEAPADSVPAERQSGRIQLSGFGINQNNRTGSAAGIESMKQEASPLELFPFAGTAVPENDATTALQADDQAQSSGRPFGDPVITGESRGDLFMERLMGLTDDAGMKGERGEKIPIGLQNTVNAAEEEGINEHTARHRVNRPVNPSLKAAGMENFNVEADEQTPLGYTPQGLQKASVEERVETYRTVMQGPAGGREVLDAALSGSGVRLGTGQGQRDRNPSVQDKSKGWAGSPESSGMNSIYLSNVNGFAAEGSAPTIERINLEDLMAQFQQAKNLLTRDSGRVRITLNPPSLGTLDMEVVVRQNRVEVIMRVDNVLVQQVLQANADELKANLQGQGLSFEGLNILNGGATDRQDSAFANNGTLQRESQGWWRTGQAQDSDETKSVEILAERPQQRYDSGTGVISLFV